MQSTKGSWTAVDVVKSVCQCWIFVGRVTWHLRDPFHQALCSARQQSRLNFHPWVLSDIHCLVRTEPSQNCASLSIGINIHVKVLWLWRFATFCQAPVQVQFQVKGLQRWIFVRPLPFVQMEASWSSWRWRNPETKSFVSCHHPSESMLFKLGAEVIQAWMHVQHPKKFDGVHSVHAQ